VKIFVGLQDVGLRVQNIVQELGEKKSCPLVFLLRLSELLLQILMLLQQSVVFLLLNDHISLLLLKFLLQKVDQIIVASVSTGFGH